jgi:hypothetical protein
MLDANQLDEGVGDTLVSVDTQRLMGVTRLRSRRPVHVTLTKRRTSSGRISLNSTNVASLIPSNIDLVGEHSGFRRVGCEAHPFEE